MTTPKYNLTELRNLQEDDELDLSASAIQDFPKAITQLTRLTKLDLSSNRIAFLPESFCTMDKLIRLDLGNNQLHHLPDGIGLMKSLQHLNLYNNKLEDLPLSFGNLKSLKWLDLKKNPINKPLLAIAGNCGTDAECKTAAKQVVNVYMGEKQKEFAHKKAQEAKLKEKVAKAQQEEKIRKHQEKKQKEAEMKAEKDAKQREHASNNKSQQHTPPHKEHQKPHKKETSHNKASDAKKTEKPRGFFRKLFGFIWTCFFYLTLILATSSTIAIGLDCKGLGTPIPGTAPLCKDLSLIGTGNKPSAAFVQNTKKAYGQVLTGYHNQLKPHVAPIQASISKQWKQFAKTDIGKKVESIAFQVHTWIVDKWVKVQRFVQQQWAKIQAWWKSTGQKQFGPALEGFMIGLKMVFQIVADIARHFAGLLVHFVARVKTFFLAWSDGGFNAAMNTLNH
ncbi:hypothetical protein GCK72_008778 [Caenorhabditis remanei]|uniref:Disease resistance R13L4/SHOC-2-like LRR domain-containing protein n=1 Tax=Caenorhabditis remanei TaxID=31234 RepID=A0A6A5H0K5_CAERE|nr:hypothetical protein GCK72_008778 [Caenorhabditis remanei]KAF1760529.1 hypothetical protein GCK72_008778 [Caenorhabditis remanei]